MAVMDEVVYAPLPHQNFYRIEYYNKYYVWEHLERTVKLASGPLVVRDSYRLLDDAVQTADRLAEHGWTVRVVKRTETFDD